MSVVLDNAFNEEDKASPEKYS